MGTTEEARPPDGVPALQAVRLERTKGRALMADNEATGKTFAEFVKEAGIPAEHIERFNKATDIAVAAGLAERSPDGEALRLTDSGRDVAMLVAELLPPAVLMNIAVMVSMMGKANESFPTEQDGEGE